MSYFKVPKRIEVLANRPIEVEVNALEVEYMKLVNREELSKRDEQLMNYLHARCHKLWKKIARYK